MCPAPLKLAGQVTAGMIDKILAVVFANLPQFFVGDLVDRVPHVEVGEFIDVGGAAVLEKEVKERGGEPCAGVHTVDDGSDGDFVLRDV